MAYSDIELLFGVATGGSEAGDSEENIRGQLEAIMNSINSKPMQVKVELNYEGEIEKLRSKLSGEKIDIGEINLTSSGTIGGLEEVVSNLKEISSLVREISAKNFGFDFSFSSGGDPAQQTEDYLNLAQKKADVLKALYQNLFNEINRGGSSVFKRLGEKDGAITYAYLKDFDIDKLTNISGAKSLSAIQSKIKGLDEAILDLETIINRMNSKGFNIDLVDKSGIDKATKQIETNKESAEQMNVSMADMLKSAIGGQISVTAPVADGMNQAVAPAQQVATATQKIADEAERAGEALKGAATTMTDVAGSEKTAGEGTDEIVESAERTKVTETERQNALRKSYELLTRMQEAQKNWNTAGQAGAQSSEQYTKLGTDIDQLKKLIDQYDKGQINIKQFNLEYAKLAKNFAENSNAIKDAGEAVKTVTQSPEEKSRELKYASDMLSKMQAQIRSIGNATGGIFGDTPEGNAAQSQYQAMSGYVEKVKELIEQYKQGAISANDFQTQLQGTLASFSENQAYVSQYASDMRDSLNTETQWQGVLKQTEVALKRVTDAQNNWTKAQNGTTSDEYKKLEEYSNSLLALKARHDAGTISLRQYKEQLAIINAEFAETSNVIHQAGEDTLSFSDKLGSIASKFTAWFSVSQVIMKATDAAKQMLNMAIEIDSAMTQLKIVTGATDAQVAGFLKESTRLAKELGQNISDVAASIETFSRLGYTFDEASKLAEYSTILSNTAAVDVNEATTGLTSIIKGYNLNVSDAEHVADVLIKVGQEYAVSASELMEAFERSGAALNATNLSFEKSAGLIAAANAAVQDSSTVGTALKTVSARIRTSKTDLEELGEDTTDLANGFSKYASELKAITGFDIVVEGTTDQYKDLYEIFDGVGQAWDTLSDTQQARVAEILGGTRQLQVVSSILANWEDAAGAYAAAMDSAGTATQAQAIWADSMTSHIQKFKTSFQELATTVIDSDLVKTIVDTGSVILEIVNAVATAFNALGGIKTVLAGVGFAGIKEVVSNVKALNDGVDSFVGISAKIFQWLKQIKDEADEAGVSVLEYIENLTSLGDTFKAVLKNPVTWIAAVSLGITLFKNYIGKLETANNELIAVGKTASTQVKKIKQVTVNYETAIKAKDNTVGANNRLQTATNELIEVLGLEDEQVQNLAEHYQDLSSDGINAAIADIEAAVLAAERNITRELTNSPVLNYLIGIFDRITNFQTGKVTDAIRNALSTDGIFLDDTAENYVAEYKMLSGILTKMKKAGVDSINIGGVVLTYDEIVSAVGDMKSKAEDYIEAAKEQKEAEIALAKANGTYVESAQEATERMREEAKSALSLDDEVTQATEALTRFNEALEAPEHGDALAGYEEIFTKFKEAAESGQWGSNAISVGIEAFGWDGLLQDSEYNAEIAAKKILSVFNSVFENGSLSGFMSLMKKYADESGILWVRTADGVMKQAAQITGEGSFNFESYDLLAQALGMNTKLLYAFLDAIELYDADLNISSEELSKVVGELNRTAEGGDIAKLSLDQLIQLIRNWDPEMSATQIQLLVQALRDTENIDLSATNAQIADAIKSSGDFTDSVKDTPEETVTELTVDPDYVEYGKWIAYLEAIPDSKTTVLKVETQDESQSTTTSSSRGTSYLRNEMLRNATGTKNSPGGLSLLGDEYSSDGSPKPELVVQNGEAHLAGVDGPTVEKLESGAVVYNNKDTKRILKGLKVYGNIPAHAGGTTWTIPTSVLRGTSGSSGSSSSSSAEDVETWFDIALREHKHLVAMEKESDQEYLSWLSAAYQQAYAEGIIELEDFYSYQEEVHDGMKELFDDYLSDMKHTIDMLGHYENSQAEQISIYEKMILEVEKKIAEARSYGLDDNDEYIQELQDQWWEYKDAISDIQDEITENAKDAVDELVDYRLDMIKQELDNEKDALDDRLDYLKEFYDKQKDLLQEQADAEDYEKEQKKKRKTVTDLENQLAQLELDNSAWAQKKKLELEEELNDAREDLAEYERDHALKMAQEELDAQYEMAEEAINDQIDLVDEKLNDAKSLYEQALADIQNGGIELYESMIEYNRRYGSGIDEEITEKWANAYNALESYYNLYQEAYRGIHLANATGETPSPESWNTNPINGGTGLPEVPTISQSDLPQPTTPASPSLAQGSYVDVKSGTKWYADSYGGGAWGWAHGGTIKYTNPGSTHPYNIDGSGWVRKEDIVGYAQGTPNAVGGLAKLFEDDSEYVFQSGDGTTYKLMTPGSKVLNAKATDFLYNFANGGNEILAKMAEQVFKLQGVNSGSNAIGEIRMGDIIINGNADEETVSEIRRAQRESVDYMLKELTRLRK